jgi:hypothetical protein
MSIREQKESIRKEYEKSGSKFKPEMGMFSAIPYILWLESEIEKLEEQKKQLLEVLVKVLSDKAELQIDYSVDTGHLHKSRHEYFDYDKFIESITGLEIEDAYKQITGKKPE